MLQCRLYIQTATHVEPECDLEGLELLNISEPPLIYQ